MVAILPGGIWASMPPWVVHGQHLFMLGVRAVTAGLLTVV